MIDEARFLRDLALDFNRKLTSKIIFNGQKKKNINKEKLFIDYLLSIVSIVRRRCLIR